MKELKEYANKLASQARITIKHGQFFAKILTKNDDAGRHGVLIPSDAYTLFPVFDIQDPSVNDTIEFISHEAQDGVAKNIAYKYYHRYPERRITRLNALINDQLQGKRLQVFFCAELTDGSTAYFHDSTNEGGDGRFHVLWDLLTGGAIGAEYGAYIVTPIEFNGLHLDAPLTELLEKFDNIQGTWIDSMRLGTTGIGYTLETLFGIKENNDKVADYKGIEIKSKRKKSTQTHSSGKLNLFQQAPVWTNKLSAKERIRIIGMLNDVGMHTCYSQVTTKPNNLNLVLNVQAHENRINLNQQDNAIGHWLHQKLETRLMEKHQRAAFILASERITKTKSQFCYEELIYCEQPHIDRFVDLIRHNQIVFEFTMSEKPNGTVRNHGYPWRLNHPDLLDQLFALRVKLR